MVWVVTIMLHIVLQNCFTYISGKYCIVKFGKKSNASITFYSVLFIYTYIVAVVMIQSGANIPSWISMG